MKTLLNLFLPVVLSVCIYSYSIASASSTGSCRDSCDDSFNPAHPCSCNSHCQNHGDCCSDYQTYCGSCVNACGQGPSSGRCACNSVCSQYGDCCPDYNQVCGTGSGGGDSGASTPGQVSNAQISAIAESMWTADQSHRLTAGVDYQLQTQSYVSSSNQQDKSSAKLFQYASSSKLQTPTVQAFSALLNNYIAATGVPESVTSGERAEETNFLQSLYGSIVFQKALTFLQSNGYLPQTEGLATAKLKQIWFDSYSRKNGVQDTSGFEHVFVGEIKNGVSGSHNWYQIYKQEAAGHLNYYGYRYIGQPQLLSIQYTWNGSRKASGSMFVGTSPEFEFSLYTLCFLTRMGQQCNVTLGGHSVSIQTHGYSPLDNPAERVGSAYPRTP